MLVGAGAAGSSVDAANILKPALSRGELQCIGATTLNEYRQHIEGDAALERRFQPVFVDEPTRRRHDLDPAGRAQAVRGAPPPADHRRGAGGRSPAGGALHHRPLPARQGDRPDRRGRLAGAGVQAAADRLATDDRDGHQGSAAGEGRGDRRQALGRSNCPARAGAHPAQRTGAAPRELGFVVGTGRRDRGRRRRDCLDVDGCAADAAPDGGVGPPAEHGRGAAQAHRRPGRGDRRHLARGAACPGRPQGPQAPHRLFPVPWPDRRRQDRAGEGAGAVHVRHRRGAAAARHVRVHGAPHHFTPGGRAAGLRRLRRRRASSPRRSGAGHSP